MEPKGWTELDWLLKNEENKREQEEEAGSRERTWGGSEWVGRFRCEKGMNASERVQRTVCALVVVVAPVSWDCAYGVAERRVEGLRTRRDDPL